VRGQHAFGAVELAKVVDAAVQRRAEALGAFGGVLGDVAGDLLGGGGAGAGSADGAQVQLLAPHCSPRTVAAEGGDGGAGGRDQLAVDDAGVGSQADRGGEQVDGEALRGREDGVGLVVRRGGVQADDGVEVDQTPQLVLGDLGERHPHRVLQLGQGEAGQASQVGLV
jgi:hypothetical protein